MRTARSSKVQENPGFTGENGVLAVPKSDMKSMWCVSGGKIFALVVTDNFERLVFSNTSSLGRVHRELEPCTSIPILARAGMGEFRYNKAEKSP